MGTMAPGGSARACHLAPPGLPDGAAALPLARSDRISSSGPTSFNGICSETSKSFMQVDEDGSVVQDISFGGALGGKTIGSFGSFCLITNNITGPGMLHIAAVFQKSGLIVTCLAFALVCLGSAGAASLLCDAMARMPGNAELGIRYEYSDVFVHYLGERSWLMSQIGFFLGIFTQTAASITGTAQSMDSLVSYCFGHTWALHITGPAGTPWLLDWSPQKFCGHSHVTDTTCVPFAYLPHTSDDGPHGHAIGMVLTTGYLLTLATMMPLGFLNLDDNVKFQLVSFVVLVILCVEFLYAMFVEQQPDTSLVPIVGNTFSSMCGTIIFNFAYCPTLPSWMNEKRPEVPATKILWTSALFSTLMYVLLGIGGAIAYPNAETNLLQVLGAPVSSPVTRVCSYLFGTLVIGLGIPVFCIVMRYNLVVGGMRPGLATFLGVVLPWLVSWILYQGSAAETFIGLSGVVLISAIGFLLPLCVALVAAGSTLRPGRLCKEMWRTVPSLTETIIRPLPARWLPQQRRFASILLVVLVPFVLFGLCDQLAEL